MRVGLVGYGDDTPIGVLARLLWQELPFHSWLMPMQRNGEYNRELVAAKDRLGREIVVLSGCSKTTSYGFMLGVDCVFSIQRTWPPQLFYHAACELRKWTVLLAHDRIDHDPNAAWIQYAHKIIVPSDLAHERMELCGKRKVARHHWPVDADGARSLWELITA